jgi:hypothetical protein
VGSHSKSRGRVAEDPGEILAQAAEAQPWTRRYPAITLAALAGTMVGAPGGVAAAIAFPSLGLPSGATPVAVIAARPSTPPPAPTPAPSLSVVVTASPSASPRHTARPKPTPPANPYAQTTLAALEPTALYGTQTYFNPTASQWANARVMVKIAEQRGMPLYAAVIAIATATQESRLQNLTVATNADSVGLFQQRPSEGWGTTSQLTDPYYATNAFLAALDVYAPHYMTIYLWEAAQAVQRSGFPTAYAQWESQAAHMVLNIVNGTAP